MAMLSLEIITPEKVLVKEEVDMVEANGSLSVNSAFYPVIQSSLRV